jgi:hypothetical protein
VSPLFANGARHGREEALTRACPGRGSPAVVRSAADLIVLHPKRDVIERGQTWLAEHWRGLGLAWQPRKPRITQT